MIFPQSFSAEIYKSNYPCLKKLSNDQLLDHYIKYGYYEGHNTNSVCRGNILNFVDMKKNILEIGPYHSPLLNHNLANIYSTDLYNKKELISRAASDENISNDTISNIPETQFILNSDNDFDISKSVNGTTKFDYIISSHNFEHFPNLIKNLQSFSKIMNTNGQIVAFIPDFRYIFDNYRKETDLSEILEHYYENKCRPSFHDLFNQEINRTHNNPSLHWKNEKNIINNKLLLSVHDSKNGYEKNITSNMVNQFPSRRHIDALYKKSKMEYIDTHVYQYTPNGFRYIINFLYKYNYIDFEIDQLDNTIYNSHEFMVILKKTRN